MVSLKKKQTLKDIQRQVARALREAQANWEWLTYVEYYEQGGFFILALY